MDTAEQHHLVSYKASAALPHALLDHSVQTMFEAKSQSISLSAQVPTLARWFREIATHTENSLPLQANLHRALKLFHLPINIKWFLRYILYSGPKLICIPDQLNMAE